LNDIPLFFSPPSPPIIPLVFQCIGAVGAISGATYGTFLILCVPLAFLYDRFQRFFRKSNTAIARLQSVSLSPIYADFSQALAGLNSIRAYDVSQDFITKLQLRVDYNSVAFVMNNLASQVRNALAVYPTNSFYQHTLSINPHISPSSPTITSSL